MCRCEDTTVAGQTSQVSDPPARLAKHPTKSGLEVAPTSDDFGGVVDDSNRPQPPKHNKVAPKYRSHQERSDISEKELHSTSDEVVSSTTRSLLRGVEIKAKKRSFFKK